MLLELLALSCVVQAASSQCLTQDDDRFHKNQASRDELIRSQLDFSLKLLKEIVNTKKPDDNVFCSPYSVYNALLLAYFTSAGHTEASLRKVLSIPQSQDKLNMLFSYRVQKHLSSEGAYKSQVNSANRLFVSVNQTVRECMPEIFGDEIQMVDFGPKGLRQAADTINDWVAYITHNNIRNLISADNLSPSTQLILANAAYFKGEWEYQFDPRDTRTSNFTVSRNKVVPVTLMFQQNTFRHWRSDEVGAEIVELPYKGGEISMIILLPDPSNQNYPAVSLLNKLDSQTLLDIIKATTLSENDDKVELRLPKFIVERTLELTSILENLGVGDLFQTTSNLTGLTGGPRINLNSAIHKAKIQVDERGTEAAAATAILDTRIPGNVFICDRPFVYLLYDKQRSTMLFAGIYNDPTK